MSDGHAGNLDGPLLGKEPACFRGWGQVSGNAVQGGSDQVSRCIHREGAT